MTPELHFYDLLSFNRVIKKIKSIYLSISILKSVSLFLFVCVALTLASRVICSSTLNKEERVSCIKVTDLIHDIFQTFICLSFSLSGLRVSQSSPVHTAPKEWPVSTATPDVTRASLRGPGLPLRLRMRAPQTLLLQWLHLCLPGVCAATTRSAEPADWS